jgi:hypothetical protein
MTISDVSGVRDDGELVLTCITLWFIRSTARELARFICYLYIQIIRLRSQYDFNRGPSVIILVTQLRSYTEDSNSNKESCEILMVVILFSRNIHDPRNLGHSRKERNCLLDEEV